jgi:protein gp37
MNSPKTGKPFAAMTAHGPRWTGAVELIQSALDWPLRWRGAKQAKAEGRPSRIFVNSMSDLFHESLTNPSEWAEDMRVLDLCVREFPQ